MSFVDEEQVMGMAEEMVRTVFNETIEVALPASFPRMTYADAMRDYGCDKPDVRFDLKLQEVTDVFKGSGFKVFASSELIKILRVPNGAQLSRKEIDEYTKFVEIYGSKGLAWIKVKEDGSWQSPIVKFFSEEECDKLREITACQPGDILFFQAGAADIVNAALAALRLKLGERFELIDENKFAAMWVTDFPLLEYNPDEKRYVARHHPFTSPQVGQIDELAEKPAEALARAYDLVINGYEVGGGSIRIHTPEMQEKMFAALGIDEEEARAKFGFLMDALKFGAPPHGGIAFGLDRLIMILCGAKIHQGRNCFPQNSESHLPDDRSSFRSSQHSAA